MGYPRLLNNWYDSTAVLVFVLRLLHTNYHKFELVNNNSKPNGCSVHTGNNNAGINTENSESGTQKKVYWKRVKNKKHESINGRGYFYTNDMKVLIAHFA